MSKAGLTLLLSLVLILVSGVTNKTFALEKLTTITLNGTKKASVCNTPLQSLLITSNEKCEMKIISQKDLVAKLEPKNSNTYSYTTEPTYFVPTATPTISVLPTEQPTISQAIPNNPQTPVSNLGVNGSNNNSDIIFDLINSHRAKIGKSAFIKDAGLCALAQTRSFELHGELFEGKGYLHSGLYNRNLPYWITENAKYGSNEAGTVQWWLNSPIHRHAIEGDYAYSCGACNGTQCSQLFTSYTPKGGNSISINNTQTPVTTN